MLKWVPRDIDLSSFFSPALQFPCLQVFPHFGLLPLDSDSDNRWKNFWEQIDDLNKTGRGKVIYKVIFLGRHGESECMWLKLPMLVNCELILKV